MEGSDTSTTRVLRDDVKDQKREGKMRRRRRRPPLSLYSVHRERVRDATQCPFYVVRTVEGA